MPTRWTVLLGAPPRQAREVEIAIVEEGFAVTLDGRTRQILTRWQPGEFLFEAKIDGHASTAQLDRKGIVWTVIQQGAALEMRVVARHTGKLAALMPVKQRRTSPSSCCRRCRACSSRSRSAKARRSRPAKNSLWSRR
ncbi:MAG: hypothetical protein WDN69_08245 [Aliidongia sp.]